MKCVNAAAIALRSSTQTKPMDVEKVPFLEMDAVITLATFYCSTPLFGPFR